MHIITGPTNVNLNDIDNYSVSPADGISYTWAVVGGTIDSGQGTTSITVHWNVLGSGSVQVSVHMGGSQVDIVVIDVDCK